MDHLIHGNFGFSYVQDAPGVADPVAGDQGYRLAGAGRRRDLAVHRGANRSLRRAASPVRR